MYSNERWATLLIFVVGHETLKPTIDMAYVGLHTYFKAVWTLR